MTINSQNTLGVNPFVWQEDLFPPPVPKNRTPIMPQCFQWNVTAIVDQDDSHWEDTPLLPHHPFTANTIQCVTLYLRRHATVFVAYDLVTGSQGQNNEGDDREVIS